MSRRIAAQTLAVNSRKPLHQSDSALGRCHPVQQLPVLTARKCYSPGGGVGEAGPQLVENAVVEHALRHPLQAI